MLTTTHELDLVRVYSHDKITSDGKETAKRLGSLVENAQVNTQKLYDFAKTLCEATGCYRAVAIIPEMILCLQSTVHRENLAGKKLKVYLFRIGAAIFTHEGWCPVSSKVYATWIFARRQPFISSIQIFIFM